MQCADEEGDLLHHGQVLLQVLKLLEEARGPEVHLIWAERETLWVGKAPTGTPAGAHYSSEGLLRLPGGSAAVSPPARAGDPGILGPGGIPQAAGQLCPRASAPEPALRKKNRCSEPAHHSQIGAQHRRGEKAHGRQQSRE